MTLSLILVSDKELGTLAAPSLPASEDYTVVRSSQHKSQSMSIQIVNGKTTELSEHTYTFLYVIAPTRASGFSFPALTLELDGRAYTTVPFKVSVGGGGAAGEEAAKNPDVLVRLNVSNKSPYVGEQVLLTISVAHKPNAPVQLTNEGFANFMDALEKSIQKHFSTTRLTTSQIERQQETIDGELYNVYRVGYALFAIDAGAVQIGSQPFAYNQLRQVQRNYSDPFESFFGGGVFGNSVRAEGRTVMSSKLSLNVKALPPPPPGFSGAVGSFKLQATLEPRTVAAGEAVTLKIALSGTTRPGNMNDIALGTLPGVELFTPEKQTAVDTTQSGISTRKSYKYLLIPRSEGTLELPPLSWSYFDPAQGMYKQLDAELLSLTVTPGTGSSSQQARYLTQEDIQEVGQDIRYIKMPTRLVAHDRRPYRNLFYVLMLPLPLCIVLFSLLYKLQAQRRVSDSVGFRRRKALGLAQRQLREAVGRKELSADGFLGQVTAVVDRYISDRFGFAAAGKTTDELMALLRSHKADESTVKAVVDFRQELDRYRFSGGAASEAGRDEIALQARSLIESLETSVKRVSA
jgi:hypothetical protein